VEELGKFSSWFEVFSRVREINKDGDIWWIAPVSVDSHREKMWETITVGVFLDQYHVLTSSSLYMGEEYRIFRKDEHTLVIVYLKEGETI
jgi:hypothetical protein